MADCMPDELWLPIADFQGVYEVSDQGRVRSLERFVRQNNRWGECLRRFPETMLAPQLTRTGYLRVNLASDGLVQHKAVHVLVAEAFIGPRPEGMQVCHNDGTKTNNAVINLRYDTASANVRDCVRHGTQAQASKTHCPSRHPYDDVNTTWVKTPSGWGRQCLTCKRERMARRRATQTVEII